MAWFQFAAVVLVLGGCGGPECEAGDACDALLANFVKISNSAVGRLE